MRWNGELLFILICFYSVLYHCTVVNKEFSALIFHSFTCILNYKLNFWIEIWNKYSAAWKFVNPLVFYIFMHIYIYDPKHHQILTQVLKVDKVNSNQINETNIFFVIYLREKKYPVLHICVLQKYVNLWWDVGRFPPMNYLLEILPQQFNWIKGIVHPKMKMNSWFTHPQGILVKWFSSFRWIQSVLYQKKAVAFPRFVLLIPDWGFVLLSPLWFCIRHFSTSYVIRLMALWTHARKL